MPDVITANRLDRRRRRLSDRRRGLERGFQPRRGAGRCRQRRPTALARAKRDEANNLVVDAYAVPVEERNGHFAPKALREAIRAAGPTNRRDLGKQATGLAPRSGPKAATEADHVSL